MTTVRQLTVLCVLMACSAAVSANKGQRGQDPMIQADHTQLANDKAKLQADKAAGNHAAVAADKAAIQADKARLQQHKAAKNAAKKAP